ncbi:hypothetical protein PFFVO_04604 [Plasmodium falciparum Vietnam Oak-Knoll (FVO)]|uniref:Uncharacterized protein n=1 Tax=Plasmodium falciparum Vietnam Oak-Knoll (FVO) TaxID=1036723 RepID=A0A024V1W3_PLAFA|nr:hypothetical protein PFFVO_04604 [Plasmodium falciparum Vietnam Oak-Knoll (FVO)]
MNKLIFVCLTKMHLIDDVLYLYGSSTYSLGMQNSAPHDLLKASRYSTGSRRMFNKFICEYKYYLPANIDSMLLFVIFSENYIINYLKKLQMIFMLI